MATKTSTANGSKRPARKKAAVQPTSDPILDQQIGSLASRAMLVKLTVREWNASTIDHKITDDANRKYKAEGNYRKKLISNSDLLPMEQARRKVTKVYQTYTMPWSDDGWRIVRAATFEEFDRLMRDAITVSETEYDRFAFEIYRKAVELKKQEDKSFEADHYPDPKEIRTRYGYERHFNPVPNGHIAVELAADVLASVKASMDTDKQEHIKTVMFDIAERIQEKVGRLVERLREYQPPTKTKDAEGVFHESLVVNVRDLAELLPKLNITGDPRIDQIGVDLLKLVDGLTADDLRSDEKRRKIVADTADKLLKRASEFI